MRQNLRVGAVVPGAVPPSSGQADNPADPAISVDDRFFKRVLKRHVFSPTDGVFQAVYAARSKEVLPENRHLITRPSSNAWTGGTTLSFGVPIESIDGKFKKVSTVVRADSLMVSGTEDDMLDAQISLAKVGLLRAISDAVFNSDPATDDDGELAGLPYYLTADQDLVYDPAFNLLDAIKGLITRCRPGGAGLGASATCIVTSAQAIARIVAELEARGLPADFRFCHLTGQDELHYFVPVIEGRVDQAEPTSGGATTSAWAIATKDTNGVCLYALGDEEGSILRTTPITAMAGNDAAGEADLATQGVEVSAVVALLVPEPRAIARLSGIPATLP